MPKTDRHHAYCRFGVRMAQLSRITKAPTAAWCDFLHPRYAWCRLMPPSDFHKHGLARDLGPHVLALKSVRFETCECVIIAASCHALGDWRHSDPR